MRNTEEGKNKIALIKDRIDFYSARASLSDIRLKRLPVILQQFLAFRYHRYAKGTKHAVNDLFRKVRK